VFRKILIADRGEIALRVIRACRELGIDTVAVHSEPDANSLHVRFADEDVCVGPAPIAQSYQNIPHIISAAELTNADAVHPGVGPLAENAHFAEVCESCGIRFIGPRIEALRKMGDKAMARRCMAEAGVSVTPGSEESLKDLDQAREIAENLGFPVVLKAAAGGGGRGMRVVRQPEELRHAWEMARAEAGAAFTSAELYIECWMENVRHIEMQILADGSGTIVHLGERECSVQRRQQKLIEESPSSAVGPELRMRIGETAVQGVRHLGYESAGTVEFLLDQDEQFYFMEMNTRIQVEHPVTEMVSGLDLIKCQIQIAAGEEIGFHQDEIRFYGHAIECRINAEDPSREFVPTPGPVTSLHLPGGPGIRVDTHMYSGYEVPPHYDSLLAKVIAHGQGREEAISRMQRALDEFIVEGIHTTIPFHRQVMAEPEFRQGRMDTGYIERLELSE